MTEETKSTSTPLPEEGYDKHEARAGVVAIISAVTVAVLVVMIVGIYVLYQVAFEAVDEAQYSGVASKELMAIREREDEHLYRYNYIDKEKGLVRIPIDRAMEIVAADYAQGRVFYNTQTYAAKVEPVGGASAPPVAPAAQPATAPAK